MKGAVEGQVRHGSATTSHAVEQQYSVRVARELDALIAMRGMLDVL